MPVFWKSAAVAALLATAYNGIDNSAKDIAPGMQLAAIQGTVGATRNVAATPYFATLSEIDGVNTWRAILTRSGYMPTSMGPVTLFVPSDAAFAAGSDDTSLVSMFGAEDSKNLARVVERSIVNEPIDPAKFAGRKISVTTVAGNSLTLDATDQSLMVGDAEILAVKHASDGSVIYIVDHLPVKSHAAAESGDREYHE